jgi:hypothetical protein
MSMSSLPLSESQPIIAPRGSAATPRRARPVSWWAGLGLGFLALAAYLIISWLIRGEAHRVPSGPTPLPTAMQIALGIQQWGTFAGALALVYFKAIRPRMRTGSFTFDGLMVMSFALMWWSDPLYNYFTPGFSYNAWFVNLGSWVGGLPGWMSPNADQIPQPLIWLPGVYTCAFFAMVLIVNVIMRRTRQRFPEIGAVGLWLVAFFPMLVVGTLWEALFMVMGSHHYGSAIRGFALNAGHYYEFPIYQGITASLLYTTWGAMRFHRDDRGRSFAERGLDRLAVSERTEGWMRFFAISGAITGVFFVFYHIPNAIIALEGDAWPKDVLTRSYFTSGVCGAGTTVACPDPRVPFPRGNSSLRIAPGGTLVIPAGTTPPTAVPWTTKP